MIRSTAYAVSRDETRPALMGILWEIRPQGLRMVATDAHRLARVSGSFGWDCKEERNLIADTQGLLQLLRLAEGAESVQIHLGANQLSFRVDETELHTRLLDGPFPDYEAVIPRQNDRRVTIDRELLSQAVRRVSITADRMTSQIRLGIERGRMELSATGTDGSRSEDEIQVGYDGDAIEIGFNFTYLQDILRNLRDSTVEMAIKDPQSAVLITPASGEGSGPDVLCLLMPLRLTAD
jgi:DNA polymerase-3 subunit beta